MWQCPNELRAHRTRTHMTEVVKDTKANIADWSGLTIARAVLMSSHVVAQRTAELMEDRSALQWSLPFGSCLCRLVHDTTGQQLGLI